MKLLIFKDMFHIILNLFRYISKKNHLQTLQLVSTGNNITSWPILLRSCIKYYYEFDIICSAS